MMAMPVFKVYRMRDAHYQQFRWAPHTVGVAEVKRKDYEPAGEVEAPSVYAAWSQLREKGQAPRVGDLFEAEGGDLHIFKYVGIEAAHWFVPEVKPGPEAADQLREAPGGSAPAP